MSLSFRRLVAAGAVLALACTTEPEPIGPEPEHPSVRPTFVGPSVAVCGQAVTSDFTLANDLTCAGDALVVMADDIAINLNGHTIAGDGTGNGVTVRLRTGVTIKGGTIRGFVTGIFIAQSRIITVKDNQFTANREGIFLNGTSTSIIKSNVVWDNTLRGIMLRPTISGIVSSHNIVKDNQLRGNPSGILLFGQPDNTLKGNTITGSTLAALDLTGGGATGNTVIENRLAESAAGIKFGPGWNGNRFIGNHLLANTCGTEGSGENNIYTDNVFAGNTTDVCP